MVQQKTVKVKADLKRNRLQVTLSGSISKKEMENLYTEIRFGVADLKPGFSVITDLRQCRIGHLSGVAIFMKINEYLSSKQVGAVIRILKKKNLLFKQLSRLAARNAPYEVIYVSSEEEAEAKLAED